MTRTSGCRAISYVSGLGLMAFVLAGCAAASSAGEPRTTETTAQAGPAQIGVSHRTVQLADRLARAEKAYQAGDCAALAAILTAFATSPPRPLQASEESRLETWARAARVDLPPMRGRVLGPGYMRGTLKSGESWTHEQNFLAGEPASLAVSNRGSGPLELHVSNGRKSSVCSFRASSRRVCRFTPIYTQRYRIELTNEGSNDAVYYVVID